MGLALRDVQRSQSSSDQRHQRRGVHGSHDYQLGSKDRNHAAAHDAGVGALEFLIMNWARVRRGAFFSGVLVFLLAFPYGPLFPWSPWKPGYEHLALQRADIYWPTGTT